LKIVCEHRGKYLDPNKGDKKNHPLEEWLSFFVLISERRLFLFKQVEELIQLWQDHDSCAAVGCTAFL